MKISTQTFKYRDGEVDLTGVLAWDATRTGKRAGILVVHGGAGLDDHAKRQALRMAEAGYIVFACDMYGNGVAGDRQRVMTRVMELRKDTTGLCRRATAGIEVLRSHPMVDGHIAAVGYCFGGMTVLELARSGAGVVAVVSVHGTLSTSQRVEPGSIKAKILVCHGALDPHVPVTQVNAFMEEMSRAQTDWQLIVYGEAMHGFTDEGGLEAPGVAYHAATDVRSLNAIRSFLAELLPCVLLS